MKPRIQKLRQQSLDAINSISAERALLITEFYEKHALPDEPVPIQRARAFEFLLASKQICINHGELIVGERGPAAKATPTYPEINLHSLEDLDILNSREKVWFRVDDETRKAYHEKIIPFWTGRSNRDRIMQSMSPKWLEAYQVGIFTEFMEQRAPGHTVAGGKIFGCGMNDLVGEIDQVLLKPNLTEAQKAQLNAMRITAEAIVHYALRHALKLEEMAAKEKENQRREELTQMAAICRKVPAQSPETFHEALQHYWFIHLGVITELNPWDAFNPGRLDQNLYPFFSKEMAEGSLTKESATELLQSFWIKFNNHPAPPKVGITAKESNTYTDFTLINLGGVKPDGTDAVNELSFIILDVIEEMRLLQPGTMVQVSHKNPDSFVERAVKIIKTGFGQPSVFNTDAIIQELTVQGKSIEDARNGGASGCVESGAFGTESYILTGYFNLPKILEITLHNGVDPRTGKQLGPQTGELKDFVNYHDLLNAFKLQTEHFVKLKIKGSHQIEEIFMNHMPVPFLSLIIEDCIKNGKDYNCGGARYNTNYIQGVGLGTITDSFTALKLHLYDEKNILPQEFLKILAEDFQGADELRFRLLYKTPKYGNDEHCADQQLSDVFNIFHDAVTGHVSPRGATYHINLLPTTCHIYFGSVMHATPDGRKAGTPVSEGISPVQGADIHGPTAVLQSAAKIDHLRTGGTLLNQKFTPSFFKDETAIKKIVALIRGYFKMNGHHIQFNVVDAATLREAQQHPEKYRDLIVRVAGYSDYFNDLTPELQDEIIRRTEQDY